MALQPHDVAGQTPEGFRAADTIIGHVANSGLDHPIVHLPPLMGIDFSVTKHVFMLWLVSATLFIIVTLAVRRQLRLGSVVPTRLMAAIEFATDFVREKIARPNVGDAWVSTWTPLLLTFFLFILCANAIGLVPLFETLGLLNHVVLHGGEDAFLSRLVHGGSTATANFNVTAGLAMVSFGAVVLAGSKAHGFLGHWKNLVPSGVPKPLYILLIPLELLGMVVRPFALTMRLAANMTGGHIAVLAILSFVFIFTELSGSGAVGIAVGALVSTPLAVGIYGLELIVVLVQAYVFTLLTAVFIGMAIHAH